MKTYNFTFIISKPSVDELKAANLLYENNCDDALFGVSNGIYEIEFDRDAESYDGAKRSAVKDFNSANIGSEIVRIIYEE
jgi:hypothetical protein